jgi:hypothetical protein
MSSGFLVFPLHFVIISFPSLKAPAATWKAFTHLVHFQLKNCCSCDHLDVDVSWKQTRNQQLSLPSYAIISFQIYLRRKLMQNLNKFHLFLTNTAPDLSFFVRSWRMINAKFHASQAAEASAFISGDAEERSKSSRQAKRLRKVNQSDLTAFH